jgi:hypothetical protein
MMYIIISVKKYGNKIATKGDTKWETVSYMISDIYDEKF